MSENPYRLNIEQIKAFLPHRTPFLLVDRVLEIHPAGDVNDRSENGKVGTKVVALKNVSFNEPYFQGHFPARPIVPGVLVIETIAQAASFSLHPFFAGKSDRAIECILVGVDGARFRRPIVPGDTMRIETEVTKVRGSLWGFSGTVTVDGQKVAEADIIAKLLSNWADS